MVTIHAQTRQCLYVPILAKAIVTLIKCAYYTRCDIQLSKYSILHLLHFKHVIILVGAEGS